MADPIPQSFETDPAYLVQQAMLQARWDARMSQVEFAAYLNVAVEVLDFWERGEVPPPSDMLIRALQKGQEVSEVTGEVDMKRRQFLQKGATGLLGLLAVGPAGFDGWARVVHSLQNPSTLDRQAVASFAKATANFHMLEPKLAPRTLLTAVSSQFELLTGFLNGVLQPALRQQLSSVAGETAALAALLCYDLDETQAAGEWCRLGLTLAQDSGDRALGAYLLGRVACQPYYRERPEERLRQLEHGVYGFKPADAAPVARAWLATKEAEAYALLQDADRCRAALQQADTIMAGASYRDDERRSRQGFAASMQFAAAKASSLAMVGQADEARALLEPALASLDPSAIRIRYWWLPTLASTYVQQGEIEKACQVASEALAGAVRDGVETNVQMVLAFRKELAPYRDSIPVQRFEDQVSALVGAA